MAYEDIRDFFGGLSGVEDETLGQQVRLAQARVISDGVAADNENYSNLVKLAVGAMLVKMPAPTANAESSLTGNIKREKVADVEIEYSDRNSAGSNVLKDIPGGGYEHEYLRELRGVIGLEHIFGL